jgi:hypothetical protein
MHRRLLLAIGASAILVVGLFPAATFAASPTQVSRHVDASKIDPSFRPLMVDSNRPLTVVLELAGKSVLGAGGTKVAQEARATALRTAQSKLTNAVTRTGSKVTGTYRYAYNGLRVSTTAGKLADLAAIPGVVAVRRLRSYTPTNTIGDPASTPASTTRTPRSAARAPPSRIPRTIRRPSSRCRSRPRR